MVGVLIRIEPAVLRHSTADAKSALSGLGWAGAICLAVTTLVLASFDSTHPRLLMGLLAVTSALWSPGWMAGPIFASEPALNGEHFHRPPPPRRTQARGLLLAAALVATATGARSDASLPRQARQARQAGPAARRQLTPAEVYFGEGGGCPGRPSWCIVYR